MYLGQRGRCEQLLLTCQSKLPNNQIYPPMREEDASAQEVMWFVPCNFLYSIDQLFINFAAAKPNWENSKGDGRIDSKIQEHIP